MAVKEKDKQYLFEMEKKFGKSLRLLA